MQGLTALDYTFLGVAITMSVIFIHWFADFVLQTHWQATNKSKNNLALTMHVLVYSSIWVGIAGLYSILTGNYYMVLFFPTITFVCHWITDYLTSRLNTILYNKGDIHNFFVSVGWDQVMHYAQLFITLYLILKFSN